MNKQQRYQFILNWFRNEMPRVSTELQFGSPFQLLVATILSAKCTDKRVNIVTPELFAVYPDAKTMSQATEDDIYDLIKSVSYPNSKAKHLVAMARMIMSVFGGDVPQSMDDLQKLPGVGRKTANVMQAVAFGKNAIAVDTHVYRVSHRLGLVSKNATTPLKVELELKKNIPPELQADAHHWLLLHGRYICQSRLPKCAKCPFNDFCPQNLQNSKLEK